ncbi:hypothetical protein [Micromonospora foliorum]|uniref:hypothetical protein n=1 Tax=Micromonospora foliorum TaxID=2911210 RepID=UPI001EE9705A|nr:hypothetical protein [Micromonospora foliorum]MCG5438703.1 hypothetical protein [Micromonospora foliorum]
MSYADLTFAQWNDLSDAAARRLAAEVADRHGLTVPVGLQDTVYAGRSQRVAFRPTSDQLASYTDSAEEYGLPPLAGVCGGDGGSTTCGGSRFLGWLALATAYRDKDFGQWLASDDGYADEILSRPVMELR